MMLEEVFLLGHGAGYLPGPYGAGPFDTQYQMLLDGTTAIGPIPDILSGSRITHAAQVRRPVSEQGKKLPVSIGRFKRAVLRHASDGIRMALEAARLALVHSGIPYTNGADGTEWTIDTNALGIGLLDVGVIGASCFGDAQEFSRNEHLLFEDRLSKVLPFVVPATMLNGAADTVGIVLGAHGRSTTVSTACASSSDAFGDLYRQIKHGYLQLGFVVATDTLAYPNFLGYFERMGALSTTGRSVPFAEDRDGFVMSEGALACVLIGGTLMRRTGLARHAVAQVVGYESTSDARHISSPDFAMGREAMRRALVEAAGNGVMPDSVGTVVAHGTSTPDGDRNEAAIVSSFNDLRVCMGSVKSHLGHLMGAAGLANILSLAQALRTGRLPSMGEYPVDPACQYPRIHYAVGAGPCVTEGIAGIANAFGFGGHNACVVLRHHVS